MVVVVDEVVVVLTVETFFDVSLLPLTVIVVIVLLVFIINYLV